MTKTNEAIRAIVSTYFKKNGKPYVLTDGQCEIFRAITDRNLKWVCFTAPTRYGKTEVAALAYVYLAAFLHLKIPVVGGTREKANKIMEYITEHIGDHPRLYHGLINLKSIRDIDKLKLQMSKHALRWSTDGWIYVTSVEAKHRAGGGESVVGEGGDVVHIEESPLIKDESQFSKIVRMPERDRGWGKMVQAGNMIEGNMFEKSFSDDKYYKVKIGLDQAKEERGWTDQELEEKMSQMTTKDRKRYYLMEWVKKGEYTYFKPEKYEYLPKIKKYYAAMDLALGETVKGSYQAIVVVGICDKGQAYEIESIVEQSTPDDMMTKAFNLPYKFERFGIETVGFQKYFYNRITEKSKELGRYIPFEPIDQKRRKEERIESLEPYINTKQILFRGHNLLWDEMMDYPDAQHLDALDALEMVWRFVNINLFESYTDFIKEQLEEHDVQRANKQGSQPSVDIASIQSGQYGITQY